jgi:hypothetical protein
MHRCGRSVFFRLYSSAALATPHPRPNALTLIHRTSALLPSILPPTPKHPVESLELWTDLLDYARNASAARKDPAGNVNKRTRIVGAFVPQPCAFACLTSEDSPWGALRLGRI